MRHHEYVLTHINELDGVKRENTLRKLHASGYKWNSDTPIVKDDKTLYTLSFIPLSNINYIVLDTEEKTITCGSKDYTERNHDNEIDNIKMTSAAVSTLERLCNLKQSYIFEVGDIVLHDDNTTGEVLKVDDDMLWCYYDSSDPHYGYSQGYYEDNALLLPNATIQQKQLKTDAHCLYEQKAEAIAKQRELVDERKQALERAEAILHDAELDLDLLLEEWNQLV